jgi:hypothetical protein
MHGRCLLTLLVASSLLIARPVLADDHHPDSGEGLLESCAAELNNFLPVDVILPAGRASSTLVPSYNDANQSACWNFGWAEYDAPAAVFTVTPEFAGPNINFSDWDCNHSSVYYGIYGQTSWGQWVYLRGGLMYGKRSGNQCRYSVRNFPAQTWGQDSWSQWGGGKFRIGLRSWSHDDRSIGHTHDLCSDPVNCVWNTLLRITLS